MDRRTLDSESREWVDGLCARGEPREHKLAELHDLLRRAARREVVRRGAALGNRDDLAQEIASDALMLVLKKLDTYEGRSRFTTWAYAFVINVASNKIASRVVRPLPLTFDDGDWSRQPSRFAADPHQSLELREILAAVQEVVEQQLTDRQRRVFVAVALNDVAVDDVAERLGSNRNAIYKTLFDARQKMRTALEAAGYLSSEAVPSCA